MEQIVISKIEQAIKTKIPQGLGFSVTQELSSKINIPRKRLTRLVNGTAKKPLLTEIQAIANYFQLDIKELI